MPNAGSDPPPRLPREIRTSKGRSGMRAPTTFVYKISTASPASVGPRTAKSHYIRSMIAFSVALGCIAATHLSSSGK